MGATVAVRRKVTSAQSWESDRFPDDPYSLGSESDWQAMCAARTVAAIGTAHGLLFKGTWGESSEIVRLRMLMLRDGMSTPSHAALRVMANILEACGRITTMVAAISDDGEAGGFIEWIAGGQRLTAAVDSAGRVDLRELPGRGTAGRSLTWDRFCEALRKMDVAVLEAKKQRKQYR